MYAESSVLGDIIRFLPIMFMVLFILIDRFCSSMEVHRSIQLVIISKPIADFLVFYILLYLRLACDGYSVDGSLSYLCYETSGSLRWAECSLLTVY